MFLFLLPYFPHVFLKIVASRLTVYKKARKTAYKMIAEPTTSRHTLRLYCDDFILLNLL